MRSRTVRIALALATILVAGPARAQVLRDAFWVPNGPVDALATSASTLYIGGVFDQLSRATGGFAGVDEKAGTLAVQPPRVAGQVNAVLADGAGGWYLGGNFSAVGGVARANLARVDGKGRLLAWNPGADGTVYALASNPSQPGVVWIGGNIFHVDGQSRTGLAAVDATTGHATAWNLPLTWNGGVYAGVVRAMTTLNGVLYLGGIFTEIGGTVRNRLAALDATGALTAWDPNVNGAVFALASAMRPGFPPKPTVVVGGAFTSIGGAQAYSLGEVDGSTGVNLGYSPNLDHAVYALALTFSGKGAISVYAGGTFSLVGGHPRSGLALIDPTGFATAWDPSPDGPVNAIVPWATGVYVAGDFTHVGGQPRHGVGALDGAGVALAWDPRLNGSADALAAQDTTVFVGGLFTGLNGVTRRDLAALDLVTGQPTTFDPHPNGLVAALALSGSTLYVGGSFDSVGGQARSNLAAVNATTGAATSWNPRAAALVRALALNGTTVFAGGDFLAMGDSARTDLAAIDAGGGILPWHPTLDAPVYALLVANSRLYAAGGFGYVDAFPHQGAAAFDLPGLANVAGWNYTSYSDWNFTEHADALAASASTVYVGGNFVDWGLAFRRGLIGLVASSGQPTALDLSTAGDVDALLLSGSTLTIGGNFNTLGGASRVGAGAIDVTTGQATSWNPQPNDVALAFAGGGTNVYLGGYFRTVGRVPHPNLAAVTSATTDAAWAPAAPFALRLAPNPARAAMAVRFPLPAAGAARVDVFDVGGRRVRALFAGMRTAGEQSISWDGRDDAGARVAAGVYLVRLRAAGRDVTAKAVRLE